MADNDFLSQFSNSDKPESFKEEERIPVKKQKEPINIKLLLILLLLLLLLGILAYFLFFAPKIVVPDFVGKTKSEVAAWVKQQNIEPSGIVFEEKHDFDTDGDTILSQSINAGKKVKKNVKMNFTSSLGPDPDEKISLPNLKSMDKQELQTWIENNKLEKTRIVSAFSDDVAENDVIDYTFTGCEADTFTRGCTLRINVSKGKQPASQVTVEDFNDKMFESVEAWAKSKNIKINKIEQYSDKVEAGHVISMSVPSGKNVNEGDTIDVVVSKGKATIMPNMYEWTENEITAWCGKNGVSLFPINYRYDEEAKGECIGQSIAPGTLVKEGDYLEVTISLDDPDMREFIKEFGEHAAYSDLYAWIKEKDAQGAYLKINVTYQLHDTIPIDHIISVSKKIHTNDTVQVVVSDGQNIMLEDYVEKDESGNIKKEIRWNDLENSKEGEKADEYDVRQLCSANPKVSCVITYAKKEGLYNGDVIKVTRSDNGATPTSGTYLPEREHIEFVIADNGKDGIRPDTTTDNSTPNESETNKDVDGASNPNENKTNADDTSTTSEEENKSEA
jgi:serine/threonine-protein kinase